MKRYAQSILWIYVIFNISNASAQRLQASKDCLECHRSANLEWSGSRHAKSTDNLLYSTMVSSSIADPGLRVTSQCSKCHDPAGTFGPGLNSDFSGNEGITCDYCHATRFTKKSGGVLFEIIPEKVKFGPLIDAISNNHRCEFSLIHTQSDFCLACHDSRAHGYLFGSIHNEWHDSKFSKLDIQCQDCHMPAMEGKAAPLGKIREEIHSHAFFGGFSGLILRECAKIKVHALKKENKITARITIKPHSVGHALPTGSALRMVYLTVEASNQAGDILWKNYASDPVTDDPQSVFMRMLKDRSGHAPVAPWDAVAVHSDHRLYPGDERILTYELLDTNVVYIQATLNYRLAPQSLIQQLGITDPIYTTPKIITTAIEQVQ